MKIEHLCIAYDWVTRNKENVALTLIGSDTSPFIKAVARKAKKLGVWCSFNRIKGRPVLIDTETANWSDMLPPEVDIDRIDNPGLSCCAQAIRDVLSAIGVVGKSVCIIGRGHAVQDLASALVKMDATVTVAHSKTENLYDATLFSDILIVAAPILPAQVSPIIGKTVIDLVGSFKDVVSPERYIGDVGKLTTSIVLYRAAMSSNKSDNDRHSIF